MNNQQKAKVYLGARIVVFILAVYFIARGHGANKTDDRGPADATSDSDAPTPSVVTSSTIFPALHFSSSGRLPIKLGSLQLGMSIADALSTDSNLVNCGHEDEGPPSTSDPDITLCPSIHSEPEEFYNILTFSRGRLILVESQLSNISPEDAALFNEKTLNQLGKPDAVVYGGTSRDCWVWIDGDVRIQYLNNAFGSLGGRQITVKVAAYPEFLITLDTWNYDDMDKEKEVKLIKRDWGEESGQVILKQLPIGLPNLQLRMTPGQVRAALPGIVINTYDDHRSYGEFDTANADTVVSFWDGMLSSFTVRRYDISAYQFPKLRNDLIDELGTPSGGLPRTDLETINWENNDITIAYMLGPKAGKDGRPLVSTEFRDKRLDAFQQAATSLPSSQPPTYKPVTVHSFF